ncbi:Palmitoyltransferase DHHC domain [Trinorchestia longiramus]|nr:Palmitoyltransferase DHHC domain [Trinorchestia longiramus]
MTSEIIQPETISSTNRNYSFYQKNQFEIPNFEGFSESLQISSEEDNPITPGQRPREINIDNSTSVQPTVVLVQPVDDPPNKSFLSNEIKLAKALAASTFGNWGIGKITKNLGRNLLVVTMDRHYEDPLELLKITEIGPWKVKCQFPANQSTSVGVIGPFGEYTSNEDLTEALKEAGFKGALAERIFKGKDKIKTSMFKVIFDSNSLPPYVRIGYQQYQVNTYIGKPWQCYKCQRFGHSAAFCRSAPLCVVCSGPHTSNEDAVKQVLKQTATPTSQPQSVPPTNTTLSRQQPDSGNLQIPKTKTLGPQTIDELQTPAQKHVTINQLLDLLIRIFTAASQKDVQMDAPEMTTLREMAPSSSFLSGPCSWCLRLAKWLPVVFIVAIVVWSYYAYVIQLNILTIESITQKILYLLVYHVLLALFVWSYWQTIFTEIGMVPKQFRLPPIELEAYECAPTEGDRREVLERFSAKHGLPVSNRTMTGDIRYCEKCCHIKPDRCHHCSVCGECVLKMDHHCPWVNNCVSFSNYKFFVLFLTYAFLYCIFVASTTLEYLIMFWKSDLHGAGKFHILFVFFVAVMFAISLVSLMGYHIFLIIRNRSTIESFRAPIFYINHSWSQDKEGFSLGAYNNFIEIFGDSRRHWFLPVFTSLGDGVKYPLKFDRSPSPTGASPSSPPPTLPSSSPPQPPPLHSSSSSSPPSYGSTITNRGWIERPSLEVIQTAKIRELNAHLYLWAVLSHPNLGDGVSYPQRCVDEDMDGLLGSSDYSNTDWDNLGHHHYLTTRDGGLEEVVVESNHTNPV